MDDSKFKNYSNSKIINEREKNITKIFMWKYEDVFDYLSGEPVAIKVQDEEQNEAETYERIFRLRMWNREKSSVSWSMYSDDREEIKRIIIRKVLWDMESDMKKMPRLRNESEEVLNELPSITTYNFFMPLKADSLIIELLSGLDALLEQGIALSNGNSSGRQWRDMELLRLYNWGQIHLTWCPYKTNTPVEAKLFEMMEEMERLINMEKEDIYSMDFIYELTPEKYLKDYYYKLIK